MKHYRTPEKVNAGSMADIAFLLLIFFLVTTTISIDAGIKRQLPSPCSDLDDCTKTVAERNLINIELNASNEILVNEQLIEIGKLKQILMDFIDNNGDSSCSYCHGIQNPLASDNPKKAVIAITHTRQTPYEVFIQVQDETTKAIMELREAYSLNRFNQPYSDLKAVDQIIVQKAYPISISEIVK
ncbi:ExbD/TolR family protein [Hanstruepera marina]|uniref:ExbD/TolR family protein n=1 Tax=Hanstruepera marina TaxID=2873265 RepID=UPI001CA5FA39|nr:biopolymer transporter ExbD [Hanstruepera marina]